jgi:rhodanese-related sulfurtransferase
MRWINVTLALLLTATFAAAAEAPRVEPAAAAKRVAEGRAILIDVREPNEWAQTGVATPALLLPKSDFDGEKKQWQKVLAGVGDKEVILYCRSGRRSGIVAEALAKEGFKVANAGGFEDWRKAGLPVKKVETPAPASPVR